MLKVAVVILNWNGKELLEKFLPAAIQHTNIPNCEVIVADNASTDDSVEFLKENHPDIRCIHLDQNYGFARGYNKALQQINAEYFLLLNSDIEVTENWLAPMIEVMESNSKNAVVTPKIKSYRNKDQYEYAGAAGGYIDKFGFPFCRGRIFDHEEEDTGQYDNEKNIFWASGACLMIKSELYLNSGGLDEDFFAHMEEIDLCWRLKNQGYNIVFTPNSTVYHVGAATLAKANPRKTYLNFRNNLFLLFKNLPHEKHVTILFFRMLFDGVAALKFLAGGELDNFLAVLDAHISFYGNIKLMKKKRAGLVKIFVRYKHDEMFRSSIVIDYYLKRKKKFTQLKHND